MINDGIETAASAIVENWRNEVTAEEASDLELLVKTSLSLERARCITVIHSLVRFIETQPPSKLATLTITTAKTLAVGISKGGWEEDEDIKAAETWLDQIAAEVSNQTVALDKSGE